MARFSGSDKLLEGIRIARSIRAVSDLDLDREASQRIRRRLKSKLANLLGPSEKQEVPDTKPQEFKVQSSSETIRSKKSASPEMKVRQLVMADATWAQMSKYVWETYENKPTSELAATVFELVVLRGGIEDAALAFSKLNHLHPEFLKDVDPSLRETIFETYRYSAVGRGVIGQLIRHRDASWLRESDRLWVLLEYVSRKYHEQVFSYYITFKGSVEHALCQPLHKHNFNRDSVLVQIAKSAIKVNRIEEAEALLKQITPKSKSYEQCMRLYDQIRHSEKVFSNLPLVKELDAERTWQGRIDIFLKAVARAAEGSLTAQQRTAVNYLSEHVTQWLPMIPASMRRFSELLAPYRVIDNSITGIFDFFHGSVTTFSSFEEDMAVWGIWLTSERNTELGQYFGGVSALHQFVYEEGCNEDRLHFAKQFLSTSYKPFGKYRAVSWTFLREAARQAVAANENLSEEDRSAKLALLKIIDEPYSVSNFDVESYLSKTSKISMQTLQELEKLSADKKDLALEQKVILSKAENFHLTNDDLNRLWNIFAARGEVDKAWRVASVLFARGSLNTSVAYAWEISGENRQAYQLNVPKQADVEACLQGMSYAEKKVIGALIHIGPKLPQLFNLLDPTFKLTKRKSPEAGNFLKKLEKTLGYSRVVGENRQHLVSDLEFPMGISTLPKFARSMTGSPWGLIVSELAFRMSMDLWQDSLESICAQILSIRPSNLEAQKHKSYRKVNKWLQHLSNEERVALSELTHYGRRVESKDAVELAGTYISRMATVIYQHHAKALMDMHEMGVSLPLLWGLETWMMSQDYQEVRRRHSTESRIPVPSSIKTLPTILD